MANQENVKRAIAVMENVAAKDFNMEEWFGECGTVACFAGHLALSKDIPEISNYGDYYHIYSSCLRRAVAEFLDISDDETFRICGLLNTIDESDRIYDEFYMMYSKDVTPRDVINQLKMFLE